ncbi:DUF6197 family protein [Streptomyces angustmyceticus]
MADIDIPAVYERAADHIDRVGWIQGNLYDRAGGMPFNLCRVCAVGAINIALNGSPRFPSYGIDAHDVVQPLREALGCEEMADWNDAPGRTQAEVTAALRDTAAALRTEASCG